MARKSAPPERPVEPRPGDAQRRVSWRRLQPPDDRLHTLRRSDEHGHRARCADPLRVAHRVAFFSPALQSLRRIEDAFAHAAVRRQYGLPRLPRRTLSDAPVVFDPALLTPRVAELKPRVALRRHAPRLDERTRQRLAVDGSFFTLAPRVAWALYNQPHATPRPPPPARRRGNGRRNGKKSLPGPAEKRLVVSCAALHPSPRGGRCAPHASGSALRPIPGPREPLGLPPAQRHPRHPEAKPRTASAGRRPLHPM